MKQKFAVALAVLCMLPSVAFGQGAVRQHGGPPAPDPTVDRDQRHRVAGVRENDRVQWEVRGHVQHCVPMMISNVRRGSRPSMLSPGIPQVSWSNDGGDWFVAKKGGNHPLSPCVMGSATLNWDQPIALLNNRKKRYLNTHLTWDTLPQYVWNVRHRERLSRNGVGYTRFSLYNVVERRYLMLCYADTNARKNGEQLCYYNVGL